VGFTGVKRGLRDRNAKLMCVERDLGDKLRGVIELSSSTTQGCAITDKLVQIRALISDQGEHPLPEQGEELLQLHPFKQLEGGGIAWCLGQLQIQPYGERW